MKLSIPAVQRVPPGIGTRVRGVFYSLQWVCLPFQSMHGLLVRCSNAFNGIVNRVKGTSLF